MIGIIVQLLISWLLIWLFEKNNLKVLGFFPTKKRIFDFLLFFIVTAILCSTDFVLKMFFAKQAWILNPKLSAELIMVGIWWNIKSVLFEELIFRGVLLYMLIKKIGSAKAIIISSAAFGIYHWFSLEVIGNPIQMTIVFLSTGIMGLLYAYGYLKTFSLYIPCAIHLGWNLTRSVIFSDTVIGEQLLVQVKPAPEVTVSYFVYFFMVFFPLISTLLCDYFLLRRYKQVEI